MEVEQRCSELQALARKNQISQEDAKEHAKVLARLHNRTKRSDSKYEDYGLIFKCEESFALKHKTAFSSPKLWSREMVTPILRLHRLAISRFPCRLESYMAFFGFCQKFSSKRYFSKYSSHALSFFPNEPALYIEVSKVFGSIYKNIEYSRRVLLSGLYHRRSSADIWTELVKIELDNYRRSQDPQYIALAEILIKEAENSVTSKESCALNSLLVSVTKDSDK